MCLFLVLCFEFIGCPCYCWCCAAPCRWSAMVSQSVCGGSSHACVDGVARRAPGSSTLCSRRSQCLVSPFAKCVERFVVHRPRCTIVSCRACSSKQVSVCGICARRPLFGVCVFVYLRSCVLSQLRMFERCAWASFFQLAALSPMGVYAGIEHVAIEATLRSSAKRRARECRATQRPWLQRQCHLPAWAL